MSNIYPNYGNKNYIDYVQYVKHNDFYFDKIKCSKTKIDDKCPDTIIYSKKTGQKHRFFNFLGKD
jgi:hypothetical protein